ncbi:MAG: HTTM domain-containing protein [Bacteroidetes bacterium]|nr:MAG: HTTM domain-containing protein [Bacteroidota bacterium]
MTATRKIDIQSFFGRSVSIAPLVNFRIIFGLLMLFGVSRFVLKGWVSDLYIEPEFHFSYYGFEWVEALPGNWMYLPFLIMFLSCIGIILGAFYRLSTILFFGCFTYVELIDKSYYLNHYYFVSLIAFLLIFLPANRDFSLDVRRNPEMFQSEVPAWNVWIIRFQMGVVYFFAGLAKLESDWLLEAQPLKIWLQAYRDLPVIGALFASSWLAFFFSWFGCIYDLTIPFFLSARRTRKIAYLFVLIFHIVTWLLFPIGVFPWVMICCTSIFFSVDFHEKIRGGLKRIFRWNERSSVQSVKRGGKLIMLPVGIYIFIQLALPFRYLAYPGELFWHEQGFRFSWRVMLMHKEGHATFYVRDRETGRELEIDNERFLTEVQEDQMATQPDFILEYAQLLKETYRDTVLQFGIQSFHIVDPEIHASVHVSLNGRPSKLFVKKETRLDDKKDNFAPIQWIEAF